MILFVDRLALRMSIWWIQKCTAGKHSYRHVMLFSFIFSYISCLSINGT